MTAPSPRSRVLLIDLLKALAAQLIVLHHFAWFGPFSEQLVAQGNAGSALIEWLSQYGRYAVAVFIASGGFLAAQLLPRTGLPPGASPFCLIRERYLRLIGPFVAALGLAMAVNLLARQWMQHESLGSAPGVWQFIAHVLLLHGLFDVESLSAGVWYVAIDFQLYALLVLLLWLGSRSRRPASADFWPATLVLLMALASLLVFNRDARWDNTALYFFGAYALGVGSGWAIRSANQRHSRGWIVLVAIVAVVGVLALWLDFRERIFIALLTALLLACRRLHLSRREWRPVHYLGGTSYALFLVHFPVHQGVSALFIHHGIDAPWVGLGLAWLLSMIVADVFHRVIELPYARWRRGSLCRSDSGK